MKYGIITHYNVHNHGASLQLNALKNVLKHDFNIDAQALQFETNYDFADKSVRNKHKISLKSVAYFIEYIKKRGLKIFIFNLKKRNIFKKFNKAQNLIGPNVKDSSELDGIIIGSDEVFSLYAGPTPEFFGYNLPSKKVFAYAGCFGPTTIEDVYKVHCEKFVTDGLNSMLGLSMRDQNSIAVAKEFTNRDATLVCDPVILYGYKKELDNLTHPNIPKFLLVYAYESRLNDSKEFLAILEYAHANNMIVVCPGFYHGWADKNINTDPIELLKYFKYAECVVTDTFHGCVMSLITGTDMAVIIRDNANKLMNLMNEYEISNRKLDNNMLLDKVFSQKMNWESINKQITNRRQKSMEYLKEMISI